TGKLAKRYGDFTGTKVTRTSGATLTRDEAADFLAKMQAGEVRGASRQALDNLSTLLDENRAFQQRIESTIVPKSELTSARLVAIDNALDAASAPGRKAGIVEQALSGSVYGTVVGALPAMGALGPVL